MTFLINSIMTLYQPNVERSAVEEMRVAEASGIFHYSAPLPRDEEDEDDGEDGFADAAENFSKLNLGATPAPPPPTVLQPTPAPPPVQPPVQVQRPIVEPDPMDDDFGDDGGELDLNDPEVRKLMEEDFDDEDDLLN